MQRGGAGRWSGTPGTGRRPAGGGADGVSQRLRFTDAQQADILAHFIRGGDVTAGGVMHAVTSVAQTLDDADAAHEMESLALRALETRRRRSDHPVQ